MSHLFQNHLHLLLHAIELVLPVFVTLRNIFFDFLDDSRLHLLDCVNEVERGLVDVLLSECDVDGVEIMLDIVVVAVSRRIF